QPAQTAQVLAAGLAGVTARLDPATAARQALAALVTLLGAQRGFMVLYEGLSIAEVIAYGEDARDPDAFSTGLAEHVVWTGEAVFIDDLRAHPALGERDSVQGLDLRSAFGLPLFEAGALVGVMIADSREPMTQPDDELRAAAIALGRYATLAVTSARALAGQAREAAELAVCHQVALAATRARSFTDLLPALGSAAGACGAERILLLLGDGLEVAAAIDVEGHPLRPELTTFSRTIARCVLESGLPLHLADPLADSSFASHASVQGLGGRTVDVVPVRGGEAILGVLYTDHPGEVIEGPAPMAALAGMAEAIGALLGRLAPRAPSA
ncbi:MAG: two component, sigma54 specific, transcriptional regulator, Fis family, partial [Cyanobacteria bacterium RYN_339]|nr:two component, sigma54 specific, transcriptional regulator, Fis family [Cyanobacteria bacterium RYN_339]